jgi:ubiquitin conjugation factor E4 B
MTHLIVHRDQELFTRFINMLMSDITYLMDESLSKLTEIHQTQSEMENESSWQAQAPVSMIAVNRYYGN